MKTQLILALDVNTIKEAKYFINKLYPKIKIFKVGLQLFTLAGPDIIKFIQKKGAQVFLDLKFFDIPNTVENAIRQAVHLKVKMLTLHIQGGPQMLKLAVKAASDEAKTSRLRKPLLIGVTVLTSQVAESSQVLKLAKAGLSAGLDGVVCSAREARVLKRKINKRFIIVTPGIRPNKEIHDDQKRTATAQEAVAAGSNFLVIGRPILKAQDPVLLLRELLVHCKP